ncbi:MULTISPECIES: helix-turn-helix domain-containing protein [Prosthecochloris]|uniref:Helix-turn-helix transcriptional regulator n=1 Tax=Prosthecochloris vibrioformis TaxID=1098 RepID=A0A5C4RT98_PROVB|nr:MULTISPECIES: helix-turn-helix transcriptional regulator [Prosthecochloris]ANT64693.1 transcriptional regulator, y4mF family [Prosthecochloris sp. CIB 2401]TNJ34179.1 helix-turn-helix transcriptional regulator [Prosthecochloris vibrioformis]
MTENANWTSMSDHALAAHIGAFVRHHRLEQNRTQDALAHAAGISRSTLSLLERGQTVTLATLIQVLRVLDQLQVMDSFVVEQRVSPLALAKMQKEKRQRARGKQVDDTTEHEW